MRLEELTLHIAGALHLDEAEAQRLHGILLGAAATGVLVGPPQDDADDQDGGGALVVASREQQVTMTAEQVKHLIGQAREAALEEAVAGMKKATEERVAKADAAAARADRRNRQWRGELSAIVSEMPARPYKEELEACLYDGRLEVWMGRYVIAQERLDRLVSQGRDLTQEASDRRSADRSGWDR